MAQRNSRTLLSRIAPGHHARRLLPAASRRPAWCLVGALSPALACSLLALPAAASGLDPAKVNADPTAQRMFEAVDANHHLQPLGTLAHYVLTADAQGQTCTLEDKGNDIFMMECAPSPQHPKYSLLLIGENGRLLAVSMYGADSHILPTGDAFERLTAIAPVQPEAATPATAAEEPPLGAPAQEATSSDRCLWTSVHNHRVDMGSLRRLDAFTHQIGGGCFIDETKGGHASIACRFPDSRTHRTHELTLEGDGDAASCYGITHTALDGQTLPYAQYVRASSSTTSDRCIDAPRSRRNPLRPSLPTRPHLRAEEGLGVTDEDKSLDLATSSIPEPAVGIFWGIRDRQGTTQLVLASVLLAEAEAYGDCLGFARSHLDVWTAWQRRGATILARQGLPPAIARHGYEHFPRGRVVYGTDEAAFTIYADRKLQTPEVLDAIVRRFGLGQQRVAIRSDAHYRTGPD